MCSLQKLELWQVACKVWCNGIASVSYKKKIYIIFGLADGLKIEGHKKVYEIVMYFVCLETICKNIQSS